MSVICRSLGRTAPHSWILVLRTSAATVPHAFPMPLTARSRASAVLATLVTTDACVFSLSIFILAPVVVLPLGPPEMVVNVQSIVGKGFSKQECLEQPMIQLMSRLPGLRI